MKLKWRGLQFEHYILGILLAVEWIMSFTFLGYIHIPPISITTAHIPIVVIACLFGPVESSVAGLFFGLGSMYKASALYVMLGDRIFSPFQTDFPIGSILLSVGTRVLFGFLMGCIFKIVNKSRYKWAGKSLAALIATPLHALLVYGAMGILFPESGFNYKSSFRWGVNDYAIAAICILAVILSDIIYHSSFVTHYKNVINDSELRQHWSVKMKMSLFIIIIFVFCIAAFSTIYFASRTEYMFGVYGIKVTKKIAQDILHLQVQFLAAMISLNFILIVIGFNSLGLLPESIVNWINQLDTFLLTMAMAALGAETSFDKFKKAGIKPFLLAAILYCWLIGGGYCLVKFAIPYL